MRRLFLANLVIGVLALAGCSSDDGEPTGMDGGTGDGTATNIAALSGSGQRGTTGKALLAPFTAKVTDSQGDGVSGVAVSWEVTAGGGSLSATSTTTNSNGEASVLLTLGSSEGANSATASASGLSGSPVSFTAQGFAPAALSITDGNNQMARLSQPLAKALEVRVTASDNGPVPNATVNWMVTAGDGTLEEMQSAADADGRASVSLTLGGSLGTTSVEATAAEGSNPSVSFDATATAPVTVTVDMQGIAFVAPGGGDDITIMLGDTVRWVNQDNVQHTATSNSTPTGGSSFDSGFLNQGEQFTVVPDVRGLWVYFCEVHPVQMADARITVE